MVTTAALVAVVVVLTAWFTFLWLVARYVARGSDFKATMTVIPPSMSFERHKPNTQVQEQDAK